MAGAQGGSGVGHAVETVASGSCVDWAGNLKVASLNDERPCQFSFRTGSKREVCGKKLSRGWRVEFVLKAQASRGPSALGWEDGSEERSAPKRWRGEDVRGLLGPGGPGTSTWDLTSFRAWVTPG